MDVHRSIIEALRSIGERPALVSGAWRLTGVELLEATDRFAALLEARGAGPGRALHWSGGDDGLLLPLRLAASRCGCRWAGLLPRSGRQPAALTLSPADFRESSARSEQGLSRSDEHELQRGRFVWSAQQVNESLALLCAAVPSASTGTAVLLPLEAFGGDAALASLAGGVPVHLFPPVTPAAKLVALLERGAFACLVCSAERLRSVAQQRAAALADLEALRAVVYAADAGGLEPAASRRVRSVLRAELFGFAARPGGLRRVGLPSRAAGQSADSIGRVLRGQPGVAQAHALEIGAQGWAAFVVPEHRVRPDPDRALPPGWQREVAARVDAELASIDLAKAALVTERLGRTALTSMLNALRRAGALDDPSVAQPVDEVLDRARVAAEHRGLLRRWLRVLTEQGLLGSDGGRVQPSVDPATYSDAALADAWDALEREWREVTGAASTIEYARRSSAQLPNLIRGGVRAVHLLFPEGRTDLARALYRESIAARYQHEAVRALVTRVAREWRGRRPLRILEVGAGTGATSEALLPGLRGLDVEYLFTDISRYFLEQAEARLGEDYPFVRFALYDLDLEPMDQGFSPSSFDVIVAGGALNAARDTGASMRGLGQLSAPGGWLLLTEPTHEEYWVMASQAFMLKAASDGRAETQSTFLSLPQWNQVLDDAGLVRVLGLPPEGHALERLGHRVFAARAKLEVAPLTAADVADQLEERGVGDVLNVQIIDALPTRADGLIDEARLERWARAAAARREQRRETEGPA